MDLPTGYSEKYRPRPRKTGEPRNQREELIEKFRTEINKGQEADRRPPYTFARVARMLRGRSDQDLYQLFQECADPSVRIFGAMLNYKLKN